MQNPGWELGIRIGDAKSGWVTEFIPFVWGDPREVAGNGAEFVAVDAAGNIYGGERAHSRFPGHALTPTGVMAIRCKQFHLPDL